MSPQPSISVTETGVSRLAVAAAYERQLARRKLWSPTVARAWADLLDRVDDPHDDAGILLADMVAFVQDLFDVPADARAVEGNLGPAPKTASEPPHPNAYQDPVAYPKGAPGAGHAVVLMVGAIAKAIGEAFPDRPLTRQHFGADGPLPDWSGFARGGPVRRGTYFVGGSGKADASLPPFLLADGPVDTVDAAYMGAVAVHDLPGFATLTEPPSMAGAFDILGDALGIRRGRAE